MTTPDRRNTIVGNGTNNVSSYPMLPINSNTSSHPVPQSNNISKAKKPPTFDGNTGWQDYLVQFKMVAAVNNWDDHTKAYELATNLRGVAQGIVTEIEPLKRFDYTYLVSALTSRFEPVNQENMYKVQMNSYYRKPGQTLPEMAQDIRRIPRLAYPTAPVEEISWEKTVLEPKTIDDCIRFGVEYETFTLDQKRINNPKQGLRKIDETEESDDELVTRLSKISDQIGILSFNTQNSDEAIACFYCGKKGHIKRECRKLEWDKKHNCVKSGKIQQNHSFIKSQIESVFKVSITEKLTFPSNTEVITSCVIKGDASSITNAMTQALPSKHTDNLLIAKAVVDPSCGQIPIRMANITDFEQIIQPDTHVAICEAVEVNFDSAHTDINKLMNVTSFDETKEIPSHLTDLKERSSEHLSEDQRSQLDKLLQKRTKKTSRQEDLSNEDEVMNIWFKHKTDREMSKSQDQQLVLSQLRTLKKMYKTRPSWSDIAVENVQIKKYWSQWECIVMINDVLYRTWIHATTEQTILQLIVPNDWKQDILEMLHNNY
ncbi:unnamed protein product [Mytilus coruscus]|uniref:CCHC-type domain-containing protein n=1 Tax=Mytilus coruscus TaxID=42192 RepID=A0A6J8DFM9_MYTCO|nr:unnamed protein product [Mytilus coruscus]